MNTNTSTEQAPYFLPRLRMEAGVSLVRPADGYEGVAWAVVFSDGYTSNYLGGVYREGRGAWSAYVASPGPRDDYRVYPAAGLTPTHRTRDEAVASVLRAAEVTL